MNKQSLVNRYLGVIFLIDLPTALICATYQLFLVGHGLNLLEISLINVAFMVANFFLEVPTGAFADSFGRKRSVQIGILSLALSMLVYYLSSTFWWFVGAEVVGAFGVTCVSGSLEAWFVDSYKAISTDDKYEEVFSRQGFWQQSAMILGSLLGSQIGVHNLALPWLISSILSVVSLIIVSLLMKEPERSTKDSVRRTFRAMLAIAKTGIRYGLGHREIMKIVALGWFFGVAVQGLNMYWPVVFKSYGMAVDQIGLVYGVSILIAAVGSRLAPKFKKNIKQEFHALVYSQGLTTLMIFGSAMLINQWATLLFFWAHQLPRAMFRPLKQGLLNREIDDDNRATVLSFESMMIYAGNVVGLIISGWLANRFGPGSAWFFSGLVMLAGFALVLRHHVNGATVLADTE